MVDGLLKVGNHDTYRWTLEWNFSNAILYPANDISMTLHTITRPSLCHLNVSGKKRGKKRKSSFPTPPPGLQDYKEAQGYIPSIDGLGYFARN
jgi:hypothetical protein